MGKFAENLNLGKRVLPPPLLGKALTFVVQLVKVRTS